MYFIGLDVGSVSVKLVVLNKDKNKLDSSYMRHYGHPAITALKLLKEVISRYPDSSLSITGSAGKGIASILNIKPVNEIVSQSYSIKKLYPHIRTVIEIGGEDSKLIILDESGIKDFSMNSVCAAGTGSFLEQQAERLKLTIEEFSEIAARSLSPAKIAGRCSVFAKSDMIHLQQIATPIEDIIAGLCFAVARNFKGTIAKGKDIKPPVAFQGGVAANKGMIRAFKEVFELDELFIPPDFALMGALGAALKDMDEGLVNTFNLEDLEQFLSSSQFSEKGYAPLIAEGDSFFERHLKGSNGHFKNLKSLDANVSLPVKAYLGIDIGSISTNLAVIDEKGNLLAKRYLMTAGRPIEAVKQGLEEIYAELGDSVEIAGVGTTGSGRYMIADYVGADIVKNEITAQATAAIFIDPSVDTIFEIGGQDSKYISIRDGVIVDFEMNKACAAGTGSFLEEQAEKLDVSIKKEFAELAFASKNPCRLGERCTVFMENSLMANLQRGAKKDDLLGGLAYSIVQNYINRVVAGKPIGEKIFFQGGVAFNKAVVAAFEKYIGKRVVVPPHHDVTGAIGMALIARDYMKDGDISHVEGNSSQVMVKGSRVTRFKGFELSKKPYEIDSFECKGCPNVCKINRVKIEGDDGYLFYGGRCEKYDISRSKKSHIPDLFSFREEMLWKEHNKRLEEASRLPNSRNNRLKIGIPYIFFFQEYLPFWSTLLWELGFEVLVSPKTNKQIINLGIENVLSEACFPVKVAHGHIKWLKDNNVDAIFLPSFINLNTDKDEFQRGVACPYVQTIPYVSNAAINGIKRITPIIDLSRGMKYLKNELSKALKEYKISLSNIERAIIIAEKAQIEFKRAITAKGNEVLNSIKEENVPAIVIVGRSYNSFDSGVNLEIPKKLSNIDTLSIPMDFLPLETERIKDSWPNMYWRSGQRIIKAARIIRDTPNLFPIYIGSFSCGPDSFILKYFKKELGGKPFLHIEIDEHSADAGAITRCEAFLDSIEKRSFIIKKEEHTRKQISIKSKDRIIYIPRMLDHAYALAAAFKRCNVNAEVLPETDRTIVDLGKRYLSGKECYPCTITTGHILKKISEPDFIPDKSAFFMPTANGPCRFGQYHVLQDLMLKELGYKDVIMVAPEQHSNTFKEIGIENGKEFIKVAWHGIVAFDILYKCLHESRPYEKEQGISDELFAKYRDIICSALMNRNGTLEDVMKRMKNDFENIPKYKEKKPVVGIVGEIFVRCHNFSNENLIRKIESLGGEAWLAPFGEWIYYVNYLAIKRSFVKRDISNLLGLYLKKLFQDRIEHKYSAYFKGLLRSLNEPSTKETIKKASPYVHESFEGETILSIGKAIDFIEKGASGIINTMPFGCMPGTIVTALLKVVSRDYNIPCISIPYDGTESLTIDLQLEAFMESIKNSIKDH